MTASAKSDTPRTDEAAFMCEDGLTEVVLSEDARQLERELTAARAEAEALRKDAERYWWLRGNGAIISRDAEIPVHRADFGIGLDAAIDAARKVDAVKGWKD